MEFSMWAAIIAMVLGLAASVYSVFRLYKKIVYANSLSLEDIVLAVDLLNVPEKDVSKPLVPSAFTETGAAFAVFVFGLFSVFFSASSLPQGAQTVICLCFAAASELGASMAVYAVKLSKDKSVIFVPKSIGITGRVLKDIPASKKGTGVIRIFMNGQIVSVQAKSVDEVNLAKGTEIKIIYADDDRVAVVERYIR